MIRLTLQRLETGDEGTFGKLTLPDDLGGHVFATGELPWRDNAKGKSCIPAGTYLCKWHVSPKFGPCYIVTDVGGRSFILIHKGNWCGDEDLGFKSNVDGCILLGLSRGTLTPEGMKPQLAVISSSQAIGAFNEAMKESDFELTILDVAA